MTLKELYKLGITRVQLPAWQVNRYAYADIGTTIKGMGPWMTIHDANGFTNQVLISEADSDQWMEARDKIEG
ncbi:MAG: hypothetical protein KCHDKBKB_00629 [Elusimicrobia bacterium]|nr:hypothetical protein [Elusimicrobiota bacterium]